MTVAELIYEILDLCKLTGSDDSYITEEHVIFLCKKYRAFLIKKEQEKYKNSLDSYSDFESQEICLDLEKTAAIDGEPCTGGYYLWTKQAIPKIVDGSTPVVYPIDFYQGINISYVSKDRMRYVGTNPYLRNIIYVSLGPDFHLYLKSTNPQFLYLKKLRMVAVFEDFDAAQELLCDDFGESVSCDVLDAEFPIREHLVAPLIELVVKAITGAAYKPIDDKNNSSDDLTKVASKS